MEVTGLSRAKAKKLLELAQGKVKAAIVMHFRDVNLRRAREILDQCEQSLHKAIRAKQ
jgi:N-acetylmuramic acid 6-phosphate (MurNAc-6-P) etherase